MLENTRLGDLEANVKSANNIRDENLALLKGLYDNADTETRLKIIKTMDDILRSKEMGSFNVIKASLLNADVSSNVDYKQAAVAMLKTVSPKDIASGKTNMGPDTDNLIEQEFAKTDAQILDGELVLEE